MAFHPQQMTDQPAGNVRSKQSVQDGTGCTYRGFCKYAYTSFLAIVYARLEGMRTSCRPVKYSPPKLFCCQRPRCHNFSKPIQDLYRTLALLLTMSTASHSNLSSMSAHPRRRRCRRRRRSNDSSSSSSDSSTLETLGPWPQKKNPSETIRQCDSHYDRPRSHQIPSKGFSRSRQQQQQQLPEVDTSLYVALDCEMVGVGTDGLRSMLARVTLIDWNGKTILDQYIQPTETVTDYRTFISGVTPSDLCCTGSDDKREEGNSSSCSPGCHRHKLMTWKQCQETVESLIQNRVLIGHALKNDLRSLGLSHPWQMMRDTAKYEAFMKEAQGTFPFNLQEQLQYPQPHHLRLVSRKLCELAKERLNRDIQVPGRPHSPYEDALAALDLYKLVRHKWERVMQYKVNKTRQIIEAQQTERPWHEHCPPLAAQ
jgi:RNA exonuclease 4